FPRRWPGSAGPPQPWFRRTPPSSGAGSWLVLFAVVGTRRRRTVGVHRHERRATNVAHSARVKARWDLAETLTPALMDIAKAAMVSSSGASAFIRKSNGRTV